MIETRHRWDCDPREAVGIQQALRRRLVLADALPGVVRTVAGADVSYDRGSDRFFAAVVVLTYPDLVVKEEAHGVGRVTFPYIPGLLSFREGPVMLAALGRLAEPPDLILFDGQGIAHPRAPPVWDVRSGGGGAGKPVRPDPRRPHRRDGPEDEAADEPALRFAGPSDRNRRGGRTCS